ncbi:MAG TPA: SDR family oxidoreductase [Silvibacterium sp.]|nr:SDR family oxidoreductase [Silvibacterium sp.]
MKIVIFGATGGTGRELVRQGLAAGYEVTAFARNPTAFSPKERLRVAQGNALDRVAVIAAIAGQEVILSALGGRSLGDSELLPRSMEHILAGMHQHSVRRLIVLGAAGTVEGTQKRISLVPRMFFAVFKATLLRKPFAAQTEMQRIIRESDTEWTIVQPPRLLNVPGRGEYRVDAEGLPAGGGRISRADVATFMLGQIGSSEWGRREPYIAW